MAKETMSKNGGEERRITSCQSGFTMIELLVVVAIIGLLASIALSQFASYKTRSFNARAIADLRNIISAQEAQYIDNESYEAVLANLEGFDTTSPAVSLILDADDVTWSASTYHPQGTKTFCYDSGRPSGLIEVPGINQSCPI